MQSSSRPPTVPGVECSSATMHALRSSNSYPDLPPQGSGLDRLPSRTSNKALRTLGIELPPFPNGRNSDSDSSDDNALRIDAARSRPTPPEPIPMGASLRVVSATTLHQEPPRALPSAPRGEVSIVASSVRRAPGDPYVCDLRPGKRFLKALFIASVVTLAACAILVSVHFLQRLNSLEDRVSTLSTVVLRLAD